MRLPAPHIRRAVTTGNPFDMKRAEATTFAATVETLTAGAVLADEDSRIVHTNATAAAMLAASILVRRVITAIRVVASHHPEHFLPSPCASL
jgi:hypothetical protein